MEYIVIKGARKHNLKQVDVRIPKNKITVLTGVSGSGKSTLAFDIIYSEGSSGYLNAISPELSNAFKVQDFDYIEGLSPAISLNQMRSANTNPRSTVATLTDLATYLRILYSDGGTRACPRCRAVIPARDSSCSSCHEPVAMFKGTRFSFNTPDGMCSECQGLGRKLDFDMERIIPRADLPIQEQPWGEDAKTIFKQVSYFFEALAETYGYAYETPYEQLSDEQRRIILYGTGNDQITYRDKKKGTVMRYRYTGIIPQLRKAHQTNQMESRIKRIEAYMTKKTCSCCGGTRFAPDIRQVKFAGMDITECLEMEIDELFHRLKEAQQAVKQVSAAEAPVVSLNRMAPTDFNSHSVTVFSLNEIIQRLYFLTQSGLGYLTLNRSIQSLSGGELQHVRLSTQLCSTICGVTYVLDEPTMGLHERDQAIIVEALRRLRDLGNTVVVVEHSESVIQGADYVIDFGPEGGGKGGYICFQGTLPDIKGPNQSLTTKYLNGELAIDPPKQRKPFSRQMVFTNVNLHNLKNLSVTIPLDVFLTVTGVSGSGKSTLIAQVLVPAVQRALNRATDEALSGTLTGGEQIDDLIVIDQSPIGRMSRSNVATYIGLFDEIRKLYGSSEEAKARGIGPEMFSFNTVGGRCEHCEGTGVVNRTVYFIHEVYSECPMCEGKRYQEQVLSIAVRGLSIHDVLNLTVEEALEQLRGYSKITAYLQTLFDMGLGYIRLGQTTNTLSGGEAQRIKLAKQIGTHKSKSNALFIFDEPTTGLHFHDVKKLIEIFRMIVDAGNSVICIEHNMDLIRSSDYIIDMGPEGGKQGGRIVFEGTPEALAQCADSITGAYLKKAIAE